MSGNVSHSDLHVETNLSITLADKVDAAWSPFYHSQNNHHIPRQFRLWTVLGSTIKLSILTVASYLEAKWWECVRVCDMALAVQSASLNGHKNWWPSSCIGGML